ncbi:heat shock protein Hsp90 [Anaeromyces robustus]|uniref:Heat shock protein Hsp90 n=1 Tax=Anaeromyces robustus TaxID=1754192 RepID=A0A1Y1X2Z3_9FUNG|nr:heat shock protein Hsp90 [Anaeromyces robustus]|eukprot:ORX80180.1 heat shock protein Hsp90 [Anaeromyces robustus]
MNIKSILKYLVTLVFFFAVAVKAEGEADMEKAKETAETHAFETEVNRLMKLIINSIYKNKEIFLRELISNGSDALDKIRFLALTDDKALITNPHLNITIKADKENKKLVITDTGIGMTKDNLINNLGTIAKSGTSEFLKAMEDEETADSSLIGQFGVGFYSAFLVADWVSVVSKHNDDDQYIWESDAENGFKVYKDPRGNTLGRGTEITLSLREDALEYVEDDTLSGLITKYSQFINFPIYLWTTTTETVDEPIEEESTETVEDKKDDDEDDDVEDVEDEEKKPKFKKVEKTVTKWELMNENKPIWTRKPKDITKEEYVEFYQAFARVSDDPLAHIHFRAEGETDFRCLLYIPGKAPQEFMTHVNENVSPIKLYVKRIFITDEMPEFIPRWLSFVRGLVDSDDFPLNVSRETIQHLPILKVIQKKVVSKAIEMFTKLQKNEEKYNTFMKEFGTSIKLGVVEDHTHRNKIAKLLRFHSSHGKKLVTLQDYISRMRKGQEQIYYLTGPSLEEIKKSPFIENVVNRGYEVLYCPEPIDEYVFSSMPEYEGKKFQDIAKVGLKFGDEDEETEEYFKSMNEKFKPLADYLKETLKDHIESVTVSNRLTKSPCAIVANEYGWSGNMERLMNAQAIPTQDQYMKVIYSGQRKHMEINPKHPVIESLLEKVQEGKTNKATEELSMVLFETAMLRSGYSIKDNKKFADRIDRILRKNLGVELSKKVEFESKPAPEYADPEAAAKAGKKKKKSTKAKKEDGEGAEEVEEQENEEAEAEKENEEVDAEAEAEKDTETKPEVVEEVGEENEEKEEKKEEANVKDEL